MKHPLKCPDCMDYRYIEYIGVRFEDSDKKKGFGMKIPFFMCRSCGQRESILPPERFYEFRDAMLPSIADGKFFSDMPLKYVFSKIDPEIKFEYYDHLELQYDSRDYYLIPGLYRGQDDGYLTPVFFDKDLLLYYNNHPDYSVKLTSFSSGNIYHKGQSMFQHGFGVSRNGKLFKWLGDLNADFSDESMKPHLKRFQASNLPSDHEIFSKFYLSQNPFSPKDAFQHSDNESKLFSLNNEFINITKKRFNIEIAKINIEKLSEYYKSPVLEERNQIFSSYLSLNKYLIENLLDQSIKKILLDKGVNEKDLQKDGRKLGSLKLLTFFTEKVLNKQRANNIMTPLFVLNDLRQLHGHLSDTSFDERYKTCKDRLGLVEDVTDLKVFETLITQLITLYQELTDFEDV